MKKITEETLNAIQENVRTRETQELDYKRDNLFKGSWKDFEIKDLKPNLIPNGWDSFEPYGSGKNYVENWDFSNGKESWSNFNSTFEVIDNTLKVYKQTHSYGYVLQKLELEKKDYVIRVKRDNLSNVNGVMRTISSEGDNRFELTKDVSEHEISLSGKVDLYFYPQNKLGEIVDGGELWLDWVQVTPVDNQHLVVEKTPLQNGLTRIQSWGGNSYIKLQAKLTLDSVGQYNISQYLDCNKSIFIGGNDGREFNEIVQNGFNVIQRNATNRNITLNVRTGVFDKELDFIASDMQVNMGDVPNLTLIKTPLGNGRTRIQTFGGGDNVKLRYEKPFEDKDLTFSTHLENNSEEPMGIKVLDNEEKTYAPKFKGMVEEYGKG